MNEKSEARIKQDIMLWLSEQGIFAWNNATGTGLSFDGTRTISFGFPGSPDILAVLHPDGRFMGIETKTRTGKQRETQKKFQAVFEKSGGLYIVARSTDDVKNALFSAGWTGLSEIGAEVDRRNQKIG